MLLAGSYLSGAFTAGILQALLDTAEMDMLSYYLRCWRSLFAVQSASQIAQLFGTELLTILGVLCVLLLLGLSAIGPVPIYLFTMLYGAGAGLLTFQLFSGIPLPQALFFLFISGIPAALAAGALCWFGSCALEVSGRLHAFSLGRGRSPSCPCPAAIGTICTDRRSDASALRSRYLSLLIWAVSWPHFRNGSLRAPAQCGMINAK